jgi:peptidyl-prolyl cis-trans isomerase SurA
VKLRRLLVPLAIIGAALGFAPRADAIIVERIVAVVGDRAILLSELRHRAKPNLLRLLSVQRDTNFHAAAESEIYKEFLNRMIDERLEETAAEKAHIAVSPEEVDRGISNVAANAKLTEAELLLEVRRQGLSEQDFRDEIRRQILEGKLVELRVRPRVRVTDQDARDAYKHWRQEVLEQHPVDLRVLALQVQGNVQARMVLAEEIIKRARAGEDFCKLVALYSDDVQTKPSCGSRGAQPLGALVPQIQEVVKNLKPRDVSEPLLIQGGGGAIVILQVANDQDVPPFEAVKAEMSQRAVIEGLDRARKSWLSELRRGVYIDVRL